MSERQYVLLGLLSLVISLLFGINLAAKTELSTRGTELADLQMRVTILKQENMQLEERLLHEEAYTTIAQKAKQKGFIPVKTIIILQN